MTCTKSQAEETTKTLIRELADSSRSGQQQALVKKTCTIHEDDIKEIKQDLKTVLERLAKGDTKLELFEHRVAFLERIVFGMCGLILVAVVMALVTMVIVKNQNQNQNQNQPYPPQAAPAARNNP